MRDAGHVQADTQDDLARVNLDPGQRDHDPQKHVAEVHLPPGRPNTDAHDRSAGGSLGTDQAACDTHRRAVGASSCDGHAHSDAQICCAVASHDALLLILADSLDDLERVRVATGNRLRALTAVPQNEHDSAKGLAGLPEAKRLDELLAGITALEKQATLDLQRAMRTHPLGAWVKRTIGVGEKQAARLLAALGDPADRPNPAKLWQYAGHGDPARSHCRKGQPVEHSPIAKMRTRMVADKAVQAGVRKLDDCDDSDGYDLAHRKAITPLGQVYLDARAKWADRTGCPSCKGDCSDGHKHNHALRVVGKAMLLDLWREARNLRGDQNTIDIHAADVPAANLPSANGAALPIAGSPTAELEVVA